MPTANAAPKARIASKTKKSVHPLAGPRVRKVKPNEAQVAAGRAAAATCIAAIRRLRATLKEDGRDTDAPVLLEKEVLRLMLRTQAVHTGAVEAFAEAMLAEGWTVAPRDHTLHTAEEWKLVKRRGGFWLKEEFLPEPPSDKRRHPAAPPRRRPTARTRG